MKLKLKKGKILSSSKNKYGLDLGDYYNLQAGKQIEIKVVPEELKGMVDEIKGKQ